MVKLSKEEREHAKKVVDLREALRHKVTEIDKTTKIKTEADLKNLIKLCKEYAAHTKTLKDYGYSIDVWLKKMKVETWEEQLNAKTSIKSIAKKQPKQTIKSAKPEIKKPISKAVSAVETPESESLYYIMLCWTTKQNYCVCDSVVENIRKYLEKMKLEFMDTMSDNFPDRVEFTSTYKIKTTPEVYKTIIDSAEYILDISANTIHETCNVGVFGKKIE